MHQAEQQCLRCRGHTLCYACIYCWKARFVQLYLLRSCSPSVTWLPHVLRPFGNPQLMFKLTVIGIIVVHHHL